MERDARVFLWSVKRSIDAIRRYTAERSIDDNPADELLRPAVERHFEIIGEAFDRLRQVDPTVAAKIANFSDAVDVRHVLIPGDATIDHRTVWRVVQERLPLLSDQASAALSDLGEAP